MQQHAASTKSTIKSRSIVQLHVRDTVTPVVV